MICARHAPCISVATSPYLTQPYVHLKARHTVSRRFCIRELMFCMESKVKANSCKTIYYGIAYSIWYVCTMVHVHKFMI